MLKEIIFKITYIVKYDGLFTYLKRKKCVKKIIKKESKLKDRHYIEKLFFCKTGRELNLNDPATYNEKLQWLKLYWRDPLAEQCADKFLVRNYIKEKGYEDFLIPIIGVYDSLEEIQFQHLPKKFIIKTTHDSGGVYFIKNKTKINKKKITTSIRNRMKNKHQSIYLKEWVYSNIKPKILIEHFIETNNNEKIKDYKFYCFHGKVKYILVVSDRGSGTKENYFDINWKQLPFVNGAISGKPPKKPNKLSKMIQIAENLSEPFPHVRVDLFYELNRIYIGELTFFSASGTGNFYPYIYDELFGSYLDLTKIQNKHYDLSVKI